jgi:hypothetical protein
LKEVYERLKEYRLFLATVESDAMLSRYAKADLWRELLEDEIETRKFTASSWERE